MWESRTNGADEKKHMTTQTHAKNQIKSITTLIRSEKTRHKRQRIPNDAIHPTTHQLAAKMKEPTSARLHRQEGEDGVLLIAHHIWRVLN